jgi:glycosyltransferase involved in cell wall biosynthesis
VTEARRKARLAVVSPSVDKSHGTERIVAAWIAQLADKFEIHVYSQEVRDIDLKTARWHRIPKLPGPHLFNFAWWFAANRARRAWDRRVRGLEYDVVFSPGANCLDADAISVHIVFAELARRVGAELKFARNSAWWWPRLLHRRLYYRMAVFLERRAYTNPKTVLIAMARKTAGDLERHYGRREPCAIVYTGLDHAAYNPARRTELRDEARKQLNLGEEKFAVLVIGNDWRNKGAPALLDALERLADLPVELLIVSREEPRALRALISARGLDDRARILPPRGDVEFYYAAADAYAGPSLEDTFGLPVAEAMACGLPAIASASAGVSEIVTDGVDGLILRDAKDAAALAEMLRRLHGDRELRERLGEAAANTTRKYTWESNGRELTAIFEGILRRKSQFAAGTLAQEP